MLNRLNRTAYTYEDIQLIPRYSEILSRGDVDLTTRFTRNWNLKIPYMATPMDTICDSTMAIAMMKLGGTGCIHRFMSIEEQAEQVRCVSSYPRFGTSPVVAAIGSTGDNIERANALINAGADVLLIDVAHGHHINVKRTLETLSGRGVDIIAGSIATRDAARDLCEWGADAIRVGIGNGCFTPNMLVGTEYGNVPISQIKVGDRVYTHTGELHTVTHLMEFDRDEEIMEINGIECTKNHEFYVVHNRHLNDVTEDNVHSYAEWISAENLTDDYLLVELDDTYRKG